MSEIRFRKALYEKTAAPVPASCQRVYSERQESSDQETNQSEGRRIWQRIPSLLVIVVVLIASGYAHAHYVLPIHENWVWHLNTKYMYSGTLTLLCYLVFGLVTIGVDCGLIGWKGFFFSTAFIFIVGLLLRRKNSKMEEVDLGDQYTLKERIEHYIETRVRRCCTLQHVKIGVKKIIGDTLLSGEEFFVEKTYIDSCVSEFLNEVNTYIQKQIYAREKEVLKFRKCIHSWNEIGDLEAHFLHLKHFPLVESGIRSGLLSRLEQAHFVKNCKNMCLEYLAAEEQHIETVKQIERVFVRTFETCMRQCFLERKMEFPTIVAKQLKREKSLSKVICYKGKDQPPCFTQLNRLARNLDSNKRKSQKLTSVLENILKAYLDSPEMKVVANKGRRSIQCCGKYINIASLSKELAKQDSAKYDEVMIFAHRLLLINADLKFPGKNLTVVTPEAFVCNTCLWDLSGKDAPDLYGGQSKKAKDGIGPGADGEPGKHGCNGESGGNVLLCADKIQGAKKLVIKSNGGCGSNGQDGGNGQDGKDGTDGYGLPHSEFKDNYPDCSKWIATLCTRNIAKNKDNFSYTTVLNDTHYVGRTHKENQEIIFCHYHSIEGGHGSMGRESYCYLKGNDGTPGQKGGDGGCGGLAGLGGYPGHIQITPLSGQGPLQIGDTICKRGADGQSGSDGKGGQGGRNGQRGADNARIDPSLWVSEATFYHGNLELEYSDNGTGRAWCKYRNKYAGIREKSTPSTTYAVHGKRAGKKSAQRRQDQIRKIAILVDDVLQMYDEGQTVDAYEDVLFRQQTADTKQTTTRSVSERQISKCLSLQENKDCNEATKRYGFHYHIPSEVSEMKPSDKLSEPYCELSSLSRHRMSLLKELSVDIDNKSLHWLKRWQGENVHTTGMFLRTQIFRLRLEQIFHIQTLKTRQEMDTYFKKQQTAIENELKELEILIEQMNEKDKLSVLPSKLKADEKSIQNDADDKEDVEKGSAEEGAVIECVSKTYHRNGKAMDEDEQQTENTTGDLFEVSVEKLETMLTELPADVSKILRKLQFLEVNNIDFLVHLLADRISEEKLLVSLGVFQWLVVRILDESIEYGVNEFLILFSTKQQSAWLAEYLLAQVRDRVVLSFEDELDFRQKLSHCNNVNILLALSQKLVIQDEEETFTMDDIISILRISGTIEIDEEIASQLNSLSISDWPDRLQWFNTLLILKKMRAKFEDSELMESAFYISELTNRFGHRIVDQLVHEIARKDKIDVKKLLSLLQMFARSHWTLDETSVELIRRHSCKEWEAELDKCFKPNKVRQLEDLVDLMIVDGNNSIPGDILNKLKGHASEVIRLLKSKSLILESGKVIDQFSETDIKTWMQSLKSRSKDFVTDVLLEMIAVVNRGIKIKKGFYLRHTQLLSIVIFLRGERSENQGMLQQISTGEGKSLIIVALSIIKALSGENIDVVTSSSVLAMRDADINRDLYALFDVDVGHNCSDVVEERKQSYVKNLVVYGEVGAFQRDGLLNDFYNEDVGIGSRKRGYVIIDEVDSMLLDKGQNVLYLSHGIPGMDSLENVYVHIWNFVHAKGMVGTNEDIHTVEACMLNAMYGTLRKKDVEQIVLTLSPNDFNSADQIWTQLQDTKVIDSNGKLLVREEQKVNELNISGTMDVEIQKGIRNRLKDVIRQGILIPTPKFMTEFIDTHLTTWIQNAFNARYMLQNENYIIDIDRSDLRHGVTANVIIMDKDTGVEQYHSQWNEGLHQFLQLKHGCRISVESLKAVFMSNVSFFTSYGGRLYGLTGTLGSTRERDLLKSLYSVGYVTIPSFLPSKFGESISRTFSSKSEWTVGIVNVTRTVQEAGRPVLVICESVRDVDHLEQSFRKENFPVYVYKRSYEPLAVGSEREIDEACVILATNLAGRGTDLRIKDRISDLGGLHVCLTYLPNSLRVEEQAFGRAARKGQRGSGQVICLDSERVCTDISDQLQAILKMKIKRKMDEELRLDVVKKKYESVVKVEETLFAKFKQKYCELENNFKTNLELEERVILLQSCLDKWAFWLDGAHLQPEGGLAKADITPFLTSLDSFKQTCKTELSPPQSVKLAKHLIKKKKFDDALELLNEVIRKDQDFSEAAFLYKSHVLLKQSGFQEKELVCELLLQTKGVLRRRCDCLSKSVNIVSLISEDYKTKRESFLLADDYGQQKRSVMEIYGIYARSIDDILGHPLSADMLETPSIGPIQSWMLFNDLIECGILESSKVARTVGRHDAILDEFRLYSQDLATVLKDKKACCVSAKTFKNILPSREEFWKLLIAAGMLANERKYIVLNKERLKNIFEPDGQVFTSLAEKMRNLESHGEVLVRKTDKRNVCLFPEQLEDMKSGKLVPVDTKDFSMLVTCPKLKKAMTENKIITVNRFGTLQNKDTQLRKYDSITVDTFTEIKGINKSMAADIFHDLQTNGVISTGSTASKLMVDSVTPESVKLSCHRDYETEIVNVIAKHFAYRITLRTLLQDGTMDLPSKPHLFLYESLVSKQLVTPITVNNNIDDGKIAKMVKQCCNGKLSEEKLNKICKPEPEIRHNELWKHAVEIGWINNKGDVVCTTEVLAKDDPNPMLQNITPTFKILLQCIRLKKETVPVLTDKLQNFKSGLVKYDNVDSSLKDIDDFFDMETKSQRSEEIMIFRSNGFDHIMVLSERKWTWTIIFKIAVIAVLGIAQIVAGAVIEIFTMGAGTMLAAGLIAEGIGDIMFAIECACSGYCTWKAYAQHKAISLAITVLTAGIGAFFARGAKFSRYGYKIGGEFLQNMAGKKLISQVGKKAICKAVGVRVMKKVAEAGAVGLANVGIDMACQKLLENRLNHIAKELMGNLSGKVERDEELTSLLNTTCKKVGAEKARAIAAQIQREVLKSSSWEQGELERQIVRVLGRFGDALSGGLSQATQKLGKCGNTQAQLLSEISTVVSKGLDYSNKVKTVADILSAVDRFLSHMKEMLRNELKNVPPHETEVSDADLDGFRKETVCQWQTALAEIVQSKVTNELVKPLLERGSRKLIAHAGRLIQEGYSAYMDKRHNREFAKMKSEFLKTCDKMEEQKSENTPTSLLQEVKDAYFKQLMKLQKKIRDPRLFADIIREGVPVGIHCVQAVADLFGRPIQITQIGKEGILAIPEMFYPDTAMIRPGAKTIELNFDVGKEGNPGHFLNPNLRSNTGNAGKYNCLFEAVSSQTGEHVDRGYIAQIVETSPLIKDRIRRGVHDHFMGAGAIGGAVRSPEKQNEIRSYLIKTKNSKIYFIREKLRDDQVQEPDALKKSGNDEIFQTALIQTWKTMHDSSKELTIKGHRYSFLDAFCEVRVDTRYVIWEHKNSIHGHSGALYSEMNLEANGVREQFKGERTKGQDKFHKARQGAISEKTNVKYAIVEGLASHLRLGITPERLREMEIRDNCYTTTGHNLYIPSQKGEYCRGYERERYKIQLVMNEMVGYDYKKYSSVVEPANWLKNDPYISQVKNQIRSSQNLHDLGEILRKPAPWKR